MDTILLQSKFDALGARAKVRALPPPGGSPPANPVVIDIARDRHGEFFDILLRGKADVEVLDVQSADRHLLLMVRQPAVRPGRPNVKDKFLCGHDERHWFVAAIPEQAAVSTVVTAKEALKPAIVRSLEGQRGGKREHRLRRKTRIFIRQGEWFFIPATDVRVEEKLVLHNEPISRGRGKPHWCQDLYREGGTMVWVCSEHPNGLLPAAYRSLLMRRPAASRWNWRTMQRNPAVYVRGKISHPDHATIRLNGWHRVAMNTENQSRSLASVAFLD